MCLGCGRRRRTETAQANRNGGGFERHGERDVAARIMPAAAMADPGEKPRSRRAHISRATAGTLLFRAFVQILGKLYFFDLNENLRRILLDYGQKRPRRTNRLFKPRC